jgi:hypothetical protein
MHAKERSTSACACLNTIEQEHEVENRGETRQTPEFDSMHVIEDLGPGDQVGQPERFVELE